MELLVHVKLYQKGVCVESYMRKTKAQIRLLLLIKAFVVRLKNVEIRECLVKLRRCGWFNVFGHTS